MPSFHAADGERLSYWDIGEGPVCIMVHGFGMPAFLWLPFVIPLASRFRFILPNLRGFGGAHDVPIRHECAFTQYAIDLHGLIDHLELEKPSLVGFSMGGCTAMEYHRLFGFGNIAAYLQVDQAMHIAHTEHGEHGLFGEAHGDWMDTFRCLIADMENHGVGNPFDDIPKPARQRFWNMFSDFTGAAFHHPVMRAVTKLARHERLIRTVAPVSNWPIYLSCMQSFVNHPRDFRESMSGIPSQIPVWFFVGDQSKIYPAEGQAMAPMTVPHARVVRFRKAGHGVMFDSPLRFVRKLDDFLSHSVRRQRRANAAQRTASAVISPDAMHV